MTTIGPAQPEGWRFRTAMLLGHHTARINITAFATLGASFIASTLTRDTAFEGWSWMLTVPGLALLMLGVVADLCDIVVHRRNLCLRDLDRAPLLNPEDEVARRANMLYAAHAPLHRLGVIGASVALMIGGVVAAEVARDHGVPFAALISIVPYTLMILIQIWNVRVSDVHRRLQPWCPLCRWGRDDDDDDDPEPDPTPDPTVKLDKIQT